MQNRVSLPGLSMIVRQIEDIEWILRESGHDPRRWKSKVTTYLDERRVVVQVVLRHHLQRRTIELSATRDPDWSRAQGIGERHFWIDGNHWYDDFAVKTLRGRLHGKTSVDRLRDAAKRALSSLEEPERMELEEALRGVEGTECPEE